MCGKVDEGTRKKEEAEGKGRRIHMTRTARAFRLLWTADRGLREAMENESMATLPSSLNEAVAEGVSHDLIA